MANFQKHGKNVHGLTLKAPGQKSYEIGLWGPLDPRNNQELTVAPAPANAAIMCKSGKMIGTRVRVWSIAGLPPGSTLITAFDAGGAVWTSVTIDTSPAGGGGASGPGRLYTEHANERRTKTTTPTAKEVVDMLFAEWAELTQAGARTLTAQFMGETGSGRYCFNWNLGNVKSPSQNVPHMYLRNVWECMSESQAASAVTANSELVHIATEDEIKKHGWRCKNTVVVFNPPHPACRFRAYDSLREGAQRWLGHHKGIAAKNAIYLEKLNAGDIPAVAHILKQNKYYTAAESDYRAAMERHRKEIDRSLGPIN